MAQANSNSRTAGRAPKVQPFKIHLLRYLKISVVGLCALAGSFAVVTLSDHLNAQRIENSSDEAFWELVEPINIGRASTVELSVLARKSLTVRPPHITLAGEANAVLLKKRRNCVDCEYRTAYLDIYRNGRLTDVGKQALSRSYELSPYGDLELMQWRLEVSERQWYELSDEQQKAALRQITAIAQQTDGRQWLLKMTTDIDEISERIDRLRGFSGS